jgi:hypothetical protein
MHLRKRAHTRVTSRGKQACSSRSAQPAEDFEFGVSHTLLVGSSGHLRARTRVHKFVGRAGQQQNNKVCLVCDGGGSNRSNEQKDIRTTPATPKRTPAKLEFCDTGFAHNRLHVGFNCLSAAAPVTPVRFSSNYSHPTRISGATPPPVRKGTPRSSQSERSPDVSVLLAKDSVMSAAAISHTSCGLNQYCAVSVVWSPSHAVANRSGPAARTMVGDTR